MSHPRGEILGAFLEGTLSPAELAETTAHLRQCRECRVVVSETARAGREAAEESPSSRRWIAVAAAAAVAAVIAVPAFRWNAGRRGTLSHLIGAAPRQHRTVEARLSGFHWAPLAKPSRGSSPPNADDLKLAGAAGDVLEATANKTTAEADWARGVAFLQIGRRPEAVAALEKAAAASSDARIWSDLAAARYAIAADDERLSLLPLALEAADHALTLDPASPPARFNRALILERMALRERARAAWQAYLAVDPGGEWSGEAREHLRALGAGAASFDRKMLDSLPPAELVRRFPEKARTWSEGVLLAEWADGMDDAKLAKARAIGAALASANGETMLADSVAAIDDAPQATRSFIAEGYRLYRDGRTALARRDYAVGEETLRRAEAAFRKGRSPMWEMAAHFAASAAFCQHRGAEAAASLHALRASIDGKRHRAATAQIDWTLAAIANGAGDWAAGARAADAAAATYRALGERTNAAIVDSVGAASLDMIGANDRAWARWIRASAALDEPAQRQRQGAMLRDAALALARFFQPGAAASILDLAIEELHDDPAQLMAAWTERARMASAENDPRSARRALAAARAVAGGVRDAALRDELLASLEISEASLRRRTDPHGAVAALDGAIGFLAAGNVHRILPDAYLERARAYRAAGDGTAAERDYHATLAEVEKQIAHLDDAVLRVRFLDIAAQAVQETIELHLARREVAEAFAVAERARELSPADPSTPAAGTAVIEYAALPHGVAIFCIANGRLTETSVTIEPGELAARIAALSDAIRRRAALSEIQTVGGAMYRLLIAPQLPQLAGANELVIVPDRQLYDVPFAALYDDRRREYLIEQFTLRLAPSASAAAESPALSTTPALVVADPPGRAEVRLPLSADEGARVAAMYGATLLRGEDATREHFLRAVTGSAVIHYAGHAGSGADLSGILMLADRGDGDDGAISAGEIARLRLERHPLVVLAACGTLHGDSVARAFLLAGASNVVGTLWEIDDDAASPLFLAFHEQVLGGAAPAAALRTAQLSMLRRPDARLAHPAAWAPVEVLTGKLGSASVERPRREL